MLRGAMARPFDLLISVDVECDGPVPGLGSLSSLGACVAGTFDVTGAFAPAPLDARFYCELRPQCDVFDPEALAVGGLDRDALARDGLDAREAMTRFAGWCRARADEAGSGARPVFCAYPLGFDWLWVYGTMVACGVESPFGHSRCLDIKTLYAARARVPIATAIKRNMPRDFFSDELAHTHNALDDALGQAYLLQQLLGWQPPPRFVG